MKKIIFFLLAPVFWLFFLLMFLVVSPTKYLAMFYRKQGVIK